MELSQRRWARFGWWTLALVVGMCVFSAPWSFGSVRVGTIDVPRYAASNLELNLLPPYWHSLPSDDAARIDRVSASTAYVPGRVLGTDALGRDVLARTCK